MKKGFKLSVLLLAVVSLLLMAAGKGGAYQKIDPAKCNACGACFDACEYGAISKGVVNGKKVFIIDPVKCTNCGACLDACEHGAISSVKSSKVPMAPAKK